MDAGLLEAVREVCSTQCPAVCGVTGALEVVVDNVNPLLLGALAVGCEGEGGAGVAPACASAVAEYVCSAPVWACLARTVSRGDALSACLTVVSGTFGRATDPWTERDAVALRVIILSLAACVVWSTVLSAMFGDATAARRSLPTSAPPIGSGACSRTRPKSRP